MILSVSRGFAARSRYYLLRTLRTSVIIISRHLPKRPHIHRLAMNLSSLMQLVVLAMSGQNGRSAGSRKRKRVNHSQATLQASKRWPYSSSVQSRKKILLTPCLHEHQNKKLLTEKNSRTYSQKVLAETRCMAVSCKQDI